MIRVGVIGALGKMGRMVCGAVADDPDLTLVAAIDRSHLGDPIGPIIGRSDLKVKVTDEMDTLLQAEAEVAVDFTHPDVVKENAGWLIEHAIHAVIGTTGLTDDDLKDIERQIESEGGESNVFVAPNFAIGAVLAERFALDAVKYFPAVEVIEMHHDQKADAPSGTASATARKLRDARPERYRAPDAETIDGVRGGDLDGVRVHSVRLPGFVAHEEIIFGGQGQTLTIRHDSMDRSSFMPGVVLAVKAVSTMPGLTVGLDALLGD
ncbi:MAG: 4-hydroxy-tetrahydrodipicolinate reductase [Actinomycetota bacterium]